MPRPNRYELDLQPRNGLSRREFRKVTKPLTAARTLRDEDVNDLGQRRLAEYYLRTLGGIAPFPSINRIDRARGGLRQKDKEGIDLYTRIISGDEPVKDLIRHYNDIASEINPEEWGHKDYLSNYSGLFNKERYDGDHNYDIIDAAISVTPVNPFGGLATTNYGIYKKYLQNTYPDRELRAYEWNSDIDPVLKDRLDEYSSQRGDNSLVFYQYDNNFPIDTSSEYLYYDAGNYARQYIRDDDGQIYARNSDVFDFEPSSYGKLWGELPITRKTFEGLNKYVNPVVVFGNWEPVNDKTWDELIEDKRVADKKSEKKKDPSKFSSGLKVFVQSRLGDYNDSFDYLNGGHLKTKK